MEQLEQAVEYSTKGPLSADALDRLRRLWANDAAPPTSAARAHPQTSRG